MPAPIESPKTLIAVRNLARERIEICGTWLVGEKNISVVKLKACILQTRVVDSKERKRESSIEVIKMIRNC